MKTDLIDINLALAQFDLGLFNLLLQFRVCLGDVVKGEDRKTETGEQVASKDNNSPEGKLKVTRRLATCSKLFQETRRVRPDATYHGDDFVLEGLVQRDETKVETEVKLE